MCGTVTENNSISIIGSTKVFEKILKYNDVEIIACKPALRGALVAGSEKEGDLAT